MITHINYKFAYGVTRKVFLIGNYAIKIPNINEWRLFLLGLLANMQETTFSSMQHPKLCPIVFSMPCGFMNIMKRAREMVDSEFDKEYLDKWRNEDNFIVPCELKVDSFGWLEDKIVCIDYGN